MTRKDRPRIDASKINNILLIRLRRIGDVIMTTPAVSVLREKYPNAHITYVVDSPYKDLVQGSTDLDEVIVLPRKISLKDFVKTVRKIRRSKFDAVIDFHGGPRASFLTLFSGARIKIGYQIKYKSFFYDIKLPRKPESGYYHSVDNHLNLLQPFGIQSAEHPRLKLPPETESERTRIEKMLSEHNLTETERIVLHISAGNEFRNWGVENATALVDLLSLDPGIKIILVGNEEDQEAAKRILAGSSVAPVSFVGMLSLKELGSLISHSSLFVGPDSGPMHVAASTMTPIVAYFGPTLPANFSPWQADAIIIEKDLDCRPCRQKECITADYRCLRSITPQEVYEACQKIINLDYS